MDEYQLLKPYCLRNRPSLKQQKNMKYEIVRCEEVRRWSLHYVGV